MPLPPAYNYSPTLQPAAWWAQAQTQIPGLPALPQNQSALATSYSQFEPYQSALSNLYQQSMAAPGVGTMTQDGGAPSTIPTEAGGSALSQLLASIAGTSRSSTTPLEGMPGQIGETSYDYGGVAPTSTAGLTGGVSQGTPINPYSGTNWDAVGAGTPPAAGASGTPPAEGGGTTGYTTQAPQAPKTGPSPLPPDMSTYPGPGAFWDGFQWVADAFVNPPPGYTYGT